MTLTGKHKADPTSVPTDKLDSAHTALSLTLTAKAEKHIHWRGARFYNQRDKLESMLFPLDKKENLLDYGSGEDDQCAFGIHSEI